MTNDKIARRILLPLDSVYTGASTKGSGVEWDCVNKKLTKKCLIYHNDQWFKASVPVAGTYFLNVSNQRCRNRLGVQIVVIEGDPCRTDTYKLLRCIGRTDLSSFTVQLDSLEPGIEYLLNIDGFNGDECEFDITFSNTPGNGIPVAVPRADAGGVDFYSNGYVAFIDFQLRDTLRDDVQSIQLVRRRLSEPGSIKLYEGLARNAFGVPATSYSWTDSLQVRAEYKYTIFGLVKGRLVQLGSRNVMVGVDFPGYEKIKGSTYKIRYYSAVPVKTTITIYSPERKVLDTFKLDSRTGPNAFEYDFEKLRQSGATKFLIEGVARKCVSCRFTTVVRLE